MMKEKGTMTKSGVFATVAAPSVMVSNFAFAQGIPTGGYNGHMWGANYGWSMMGHGTMFIF
jgi:putative membrane protein